MFVLLPLSGCCHNCLPQFVYTCLFVQRSSRRTTSILTAIEQLLTLVSTCHTMVMCRTNCRVSRSNQPPIDTQRVARTWDPVFPLVFWKPLGQFWVKNETTIVSVVRLAWLLTPKLFVLTGPTLDRRWNSNYRFCAIIQPVLVGNLQCDTIQIETIFGIYATLSLIWPVNVPSWPWFTQWLSAFMFTMANRTKHSQYRLSLISNRSTKRKS